MILFNWSAIAGELITWEAGKNGSQKESVYTRENLTNACQNLFHKTHILLWAASSSSPTFNPLQVLSTLLPIHFLNIYTSFHPQGHNLNFGHHCLMHDHLPVSTLAFLQLGPFLKPKFVTSLYYVKPSNGFPSPLAITFKLKMPYKILCVRHE